MSIRVTQSMLAFGLVLGCIVAEAAAQQHPAANPPATLWSVLNLPTLDRLSKPAKTKAKSPVAAAMEKKKNSTDEEASKKVAAPAPPDKPEAESAIASTFSATNSSRRSAIQKRELAHDAPAPATPDVNPPAPSPPQVTPHWTPKFAEQAACLQLADDELVRPVAVTMAGELLSERVTAARAVKRMDATLNVAPSRAHSSHRQPAHTDAAEKSASSVPAAAAQLATATSAAAR